MSRRRRKDSKREGEDDQGRSRRTELRTLSECFF
jgi:hypothetical protein